MAVVAREVRSAKWIEIQSRQGRISRARPATGPAAVSRDDDWVAPAFWDLQVNGRGGHSFSSADLTVDHVAAIVRGQALLGTARLCPTLITAPLDQLLHGARTIAEACETFPDVDARVVGIHLEGPFISEREGYRGAHPEAAIRDPDWDLFEKLMNSSGRRIVLVTLAPERPGAVEFIRRLASIGIVAAIGHTAADGPTIRAAVAAGATLSTHLGNGIASILPRHPNPIWEQAAHDELSASFIADGHHLDFATLTVLARSKGPARTILVSDASPLAGLPPGTYGEWAVDPSGKIVVANTPYLAGSSESLETGLQNLLKATHWPLRDAIGTVTSNPARLLGHPEPRLEQGQPANIVVFRRPEPNGFSLQHTCVDGRWSPDDP
ncbi:MAG TPA: amidohydrolase family protein [Isosphaeraceae bacterium]|nr:amidohydrolase family protein [Isosphaeraceae bacterium]